jgi:hypothetical protein
MPKSDQISGEEMIRVIADFLDQGLVGNIVSMFKADNGYYPLVGEILKDERFAVRLGLSVLFEELKEHHPHQVALALPGLIPLLAKTTPAYVRGEAVSILGIIGGDEALALLKPLINDEDSQVSEIVRDYLDI